MYGRKIGGGRRGAKDRKLTGRRQIMDCSANGLSTSFVGLCLNFRTPVADHWLFLNLQFDLGCGVNMKKPVG